MNYLNDVNSHWSGTEVRGSETQRDSKGDKSTQKVADVPIKSSRCGRHNAFVTAIVTAVT
jgi:hypothetical protein